MVDEELHDCINDQLRPMAAFLNGRITHELTAERRGRSGLSHCQRHRPPAGP
jgi:hypothetical protein